MSDHTVRRRGTDSSGRGIYASDRMWDWWLDVVDELGFTPVITQGAWMTLAGGGANQSAGYHDGGGCFDLRLWDRTEDERQRLVRVVRSRGAAYWERYPSQGFELHAHLVLGSDHDIDDGAFWQWQQYIAGRNGLASGGSDYHWRPSPLVLTPPKEDPMADYAEQLDRIEEKVEKLAAAEKRRNVASIERLKGLRDKVRSGQAATAEDLEEIVGLLEDADA